MSSVFDTKKLIDSSVFSYGDNGIYSKYLLGKETNLLPEGGVCGYHLLVFNSPALKNTWMNIYSEFKKRVNAADSLKSLICFEPIHEISDNSLIQKRGFNEGYTTSHYEEFLTEGSCKPNEYILEDLGALHKAARERKLSNHSILKENNVIENLMYECFLKPNMELHWTEPWTLYIPPIAIEHIKYWEKQTAKS